MSGDALLIWGLALLALSLILLVVEVFVPSGGIIAAVSAICAIGGVGMLWKYETAWGISGLLTILILGPMAARVGVQDPARHPDGPGDPGGRSEEENEAIRDAERDALLRARHSSVWRASPSPTCGP